MTLTDDEIKTSDVVLPAFYNLWKATRQDYIHYVLKGGRSSSKSTTISLKLIMDLMEYPITILGVRKYEKHIRTSLFEQFKFATRLLRIENEFEFGSSPLEITYKARGNKIIFLGADDPQRIKGIKIAEFPIARLWIEEVTEFRQEEELDVIIGSFLRDILPDNVKYKIYYSYNPPKRKSHWVNKKWETKNLPATTYVHSSTYLTNRFLSPETLFEIEEMKQRQPLKYKWMYLGELIGGGVVPFQNLTFRKITDEEIKSFDNIKQGIDWGYSIHEFSFVRTHYDKTRRKLYFLDEIFGLQLSLRYIIDEILKRKYDDIRIIADSAEPKSIGELRNAGIKITGAKKGSGSVEFGEKWLNDLDEIVIDAERTPGLAKEYEEADYKVDANGNIKDQLNDKGTNSIDATRYALEDEMTNRRIKVGQSF